jgi:hypothetical protein
MNLTKILASATLLAASTASQAWYDPIYGGVGDGGANASMHAQAIGRGDGYPYGYAPYGVPSPYYGLTYGVPAVSPQLSEEQKAALEALKAQQKSFRKAVEAQQEAFRKTAEAQQKALQAAAEKGEFVGPANPFPFADPLFVDPRGPVHAKLFKHLDEQHDAILESQLQAMEQRRAALDKRFEEQHQRFDRRFAEFSPRFEPNPFDTNPPVDTQ